MTKRPERRIAVRLSRVDRERFQKSQHGLDLYSDRDTVRDNDGNKDDDKSDKCEEAAGIQSTARPKVQHRQRLRKQKPPLSAEDRRLLEDLPPHWTSGNQ